MGDRYHMAITYETLFEVLRKEKNHEDLQKLDPSFFGDVTAYIEEKVKKLVEKPRLDQFAEGHEQEQAALRTQLNNIRKLVRDLFDRREQKIIYLAVNKAKTGSNIVDTSALLPEEQSFFDQQVRSIGSFRADLLDVAIHLRKSPGGPEKASDAVSEPQALNMAPRDFPTEALKKVHIIEDVPKFVGVDLEIYGPFTSDDELELQQSIAEMLVKTNKARIVEQ